jgi:hypothetical protein
MSDPAAASPAYATPEDEQAVMNALAALEEALAPYERKLREGMANPLHGLYFARQLSAHVATLRDLAASDSEIEKFQDEVVYKRHRSTRA